jgi:hypothetical protein
VLSFDLTNIGKCKNYFSKKGQKLPSNFQQSTCRVVGGLWVRLGKIKCGVFVTASALAKHLF